MKLLETLAQWTSTTKRIWNNGIAEAHFKDKLINTCLKADSQELLPPTFPDQDFSLVIVTEDTGPMKSKLMQQLEASIKVTSSPCKAENLIDCIDKCNPSLIISAGSDKYDDEQLQEPYYTLKNAGHAGIQFVHFDWQTSVHN